MTQTEFFADVLSRNLETIEMTIADMSDQDLLVRPAPGANHAAWQLGHLISAEAGMVNAEAPGAIPALPTTFTEKFTKETSKVDDPKAFPSKAELLDQFAKTRAATVKWVKSLKPEDLSRPAVGRMKSMCPTLAHIILLQESHGMMHLGQLQVLRRKLGKPVLF